MSSMCERIIKDFGSTQGIHDLCRSSWYVVSGKGGPNAVLKIIIPPMRGERGYVLTLARQAHTPVITHEANILVRLKQTLPIRLCESIPALLAHRCCEGRQYFGVPLYESHGYQRLWRRLARGRRSQWVTNWLTELGRCTRDRALKPEWLTNEYTATIAGIQSTPSLAAAVRRRVQESFETVYNNAEQIPSVCCHGDAWSENFLWLHGSRHAVVLDWGAARWPGLPVVDLCRYACANFRSHTRIADSIVAYCRALDFNPAFVPALYDLYNVFVKAELDVAYATQPHARLDPFVMHGDTHFRLLSKIVATPT